MSRFEDRLEEARLGDRVTKAESALGELSQERREPAERDFPDGLERIGKSLEYATVVTGAADPDLITQGMIDGVGPQVDEIASQLIAFESAGDIANFQQAEAHAESLIGALSQWPHSGGLPPGEVREAASRFRRSAGQQLSGLESEIGALDQRIGELKEQLNEATEGSQAQREAAEQRLAELQAEIQLQRQRLDETIQQHQAQFSEAQERRVEQFATQLKELEGRIAANEQETGTKLAALVEHTQNRAEELVQGLQAELAEAQRIVGAIATTTIIGGFQIEAKDQRKTANTLRYAALAAALAAAGLAVWAIIHAQSNSTTVAQVLAKGLGSVVFAGIAGYLATQSGHHRDREERARRRELELAAFKPFIEDLEPDKRQQAIEHLAERIFGQEPPGGSGEALTKENISLLAKVVDLVRG